jgi:cytochrome c oxidase subunit 2
VFTDEGCGGCHSLEAIGSTGQIGPNLDVELVEENEAYIEEAIIEPDADIVEGYSEGIMPPDYGEVIPPDQLADLVAFLYEATRKSGQ